MRERPISLKGHQVSAVLDGTKTQARFEIRSPHRNDAGQFVLLDHGKGPWPHRSHDGSSMFFIDRKKDGDYFSEGPINCPYGEVGDRLWGRETWAAPHACDHLKPREIDPHTRIHYAAKGDRGGLLWRPSVQMPRFASRIDLEVVGIRVERLHEISERDAEAEGVLFLREVPDVDETLSARQLFECLWDADHGPGEWAENPWVWVIEFKRSGFGAM